MGKPTRKSLTGKQLALDSLPHKQLKSTFGSNPKKQILITQMVTQTGIGELTLTIEFKLLPFKTAFSKLKTDLRFDDNIISSVSLRVPQRALAADTFEISSVLDMNGIAAGPHVLKVELYELWNSDERVCEDAQMLFIDYVPQTRESHLVKVPIVKRVAGADLAVASDTEQDLYREMVQKEKRELLHRRDNW
jgi:hypothetical protein